MTLLTLVCWLSLGILLPAWAQQPSQPSESELFNEFLTNGIQVVSEVTTLLPSPLFNDSDSTDTKLKFLEKLASRHGWNRFSRPSMMAPIHVELTSLEDQTSQRVGHHVYSAFVVHAELATLKDQELLESLFGAKSEDGQKIGFQPESLPLEVMSQVGINSPDDESVRYSTIYLPLMNRVALYGTARIERVETQSSATIAWKFDPRFTFPGWNEVPPELKKYANRYVKIERDDLGREIESEPVAYSGCGGYLSVRETGQQPNQLLIESRLVLHEPTEWFAGSNFLRSKFPAALQEGAQSFRRRVAKVTD